MKRIYNICPYTCYRNEQFLKDCILIPYTFSKLYDFETVIVTAQREEYTYFDLLPGLLTEIVPAVESMEQWIEFICNYIKNNYQKIDILFCFGSYDSNCNIVPLYKSLRSDGKVILKLDINSGWADRLSMHNSGLRVMYENCDLITCESKKMKKLLSGKWPYRIEYIVNGYLEDVLKVLPVSYEEKEKIILTVGRIGSQQKANDVLLEAFAKCAGRYSEWKLRLAGSIEPEFRSYIEEFFLRYPKLKNRIYFTGKITDRELLNEEYKRAKIFALTSLTEGGTPNVFVEAARHGCYMISSDVDAADEITNWGKCGKKFLTGDIEGLVRILDEVMEEDFEPVLKQSFCEVKEYCRRYYDYKKMVRKMMHLLQIAEPQSYGG